MGDLVCIRDLSEAAVFAALYNASPTRERYGEDEMTVEMAYDLLRLIGKKLNCVEGVPLHISFDCSGYMNTCLYNYHNGPRMAERAIAYLRRTGSVNAPAIKALRHCAAPVVSPVNSMGCAIDVVWFDPWW